MIEYKIERLSDDLYAIDAWMEEHPERLACYLFDTPERVLIEVGPSATLHHLTAALEEMGIDDLATIVVTHIHIDHAGGAGQIAHHFPNARIGVHSRGARHLSDPTRLWSSAVQVFGEEWLTSKWGPMVPIDPDRLLVLDDGDRVPLGGGRELEALYTPGHAKHHITYYEDQSGLNGVLGRDVRGRFARSLLPAWACRSAGHSPARLRSGCGYGTDASHGINRPGVPWVCPLRSEL